VIIGSTSPNRPERRPSVLTGNAAQRRFRGARFEVPDIVVGVAAVHAAFGPDRLAAHRA
jgi:hypothetical protein